MAESEVNAHHICVACNRQFIDHYETTKGYSDEVKRECLKMYVNGMGFRGIERVKGVHHTTVITWVKLVGELLPNAYEPDTTPQVGELDELETFVGSKKTLIWLWTAVDHFSQGILGWVLGDHSAETFRPLWITVGAWQCYFYVTDGWSVYPGFIPDGDQIVSKTYMTRVESENTRLRHYLARAASKDTVLFQIRRNAQTFDSIVTALSQILGCPSSSMIHTSISNARFLSSLALLAVTACSIAVAGMAVSIAFSS